MKIILAAREGKFLKEACHAFSQELAAKDTFLKIHLQECGVFRTARVQLHLCPEAKSIAHDGPLHGNMLQAFIAELFDVGAKWQTLKAADEKEMQDSLRWKFMLGKRTRKELSM